MKKKRQKKKTFFAAAAGDKHPFVGNFRCSHPRGHTLHFHREATWSFLGTNLEPDTDELHSLNNPTEVRRNYSRNEQNQALTRKIMRLKPSY